MSSAGIVIVGGGQAGLASAYAAQRAGMEPVVLEAGAEPTGSWPRYYESLELFSPARYSALPGRPMPGDPERYPTRDELAAYLRDYAGRLGADIRTGQSVTQVAVLGDHDFQIETAAGVVLRAPYVIAATGGFGRPHRPRLPGEEAYRGTIVHTSDYRRPDGYAGLRVVVVGGGNSAVQIADELARVARVTLATRSPREVAGAAAARSRHALVVRPQWARRRADRAVVAAARRQPGGRRRPLPRRARRRRVRPPADVHALRRRRGAVGGRPHRARRRGDPRDRLPADLGFLAGSPALGADGEPLHRAGVSTTVPGLGYVGLEFQRSFRSATVRGVGPDAHRVLRRLVKAHAGTTSARRSALCTWAFATRSRRYLRGIDRAASGGPQSRRRA